MQVEFSETAQQAIVAQEEWYRVQAGDILAKRWRKAVLFEAASLVQFTHRGVLYPARNRALRGLRWIPVSGFPFRLFYQVQARKAIVIIVDVVHQQRNIDYLLPSELESL